MLTKPISLYPDAVSITPDDNHILLSATYPTSCSFETFIGEDGVEYCYASLLMGDDTYNYRVYVGDEKGVEMECFYPTIKKNSDSIVITYDLDLTRNDLFGRVVTIKTLPGNSYSSHKEYKGIYKQYISLSELKKNKIYRWKIRAFEKNSILKPDTYMSNVNIGYGSISNVLTKSDVDGAVLTIFPHQNIYDWVMGDVPVNYVNGNMSPIYSIEDWYFGQYEDNWTSINEMHMLAEEDVLIAQTALASASNIDSNIKYYISVNGSQYPIAKYRYRPVVYSDGGNGYKNTTNDTIKLYEQDSYNYKYYPKGWADSSQKYRVYNNYYYKSAETRIASSVDHARDDESSFDSYGNPVSGYVLIESNDTFSENSTYKLCCNYIDSDEAYFEIHSEPVILLKEDNASFDFTDGNGNIIIGTENSPYTLCYCNINILGEFYQAEGVEYSYYSYKIYEKNSLGEYEKIYHSSNIYNSDLRITYNDLLDMREYKIVLTIVDANNSTIEKELYLNTSYSSVLNPMMSRAEYYKEHNSVIVEWSSLNSITPIVKNHNYEFVDLSEYGGTNAVHLIGDNIVTYYQNDFGGKLSFECPTFGIRFKPTEESEKIAELYSSDGMYYGITIGSLYNIDRKDCKDSIIIDTNTKRYIYSIKHRATTDEAINALQSGVSPSDKTLVWDNNLVWNNSYTWFNGQNTIDSEYMVIINPYGRCVVKNMTTNEEMQLIDETKHRIDSSTESKIVLHSNTYFDEITVVNNGDDVVFENMKNSGNWSWIDDTQLLASFNSNFNGAEGVTIGNGKLIGYKVYKSIGESLKLHKIAETSANETIIEDFIVGDNCVYKYYIYPMFQDQLNEKLYYPNAALVTNEITLSYATNKVISLKKIGDEIYCVNLEAVWRLLLNLEDNGYTIKNSKTFADSLNAYTQEYVGSMKYITKSVSGLVGMIDCFGSDKDIIDTYDMLISWNDFVTSSDLKCYIDARGLILPGNFEADPTIEYINHSKSYAIAKFNWRQKSDLDLIKIYATIIPYNPIHEGYLYENNSLGLISSDNKLLVANGR